MRAICAGVAWLIVASAAQAQPAALTCSVSSVSPVLRAEGLAEALGEIVLACAGTPGSVIETNLTAFVSAPVTNKKLADGSADAILTVDGAVAGVPARVTGTSAVGWFGLRFTAPSSGGVTLRLRNLRAAVNLLPKGAPVRVSLSLSGPASILLNRSTVDVGVPQVGLYATSTTATVVGRSPVPAAGTISGFAAAGAAAHTVRVTEGFPDALQRKDATSDHGTRILIRYGGLPPGARLFVPEYIAGSNATRPTTGGGLGSDPSGGVYTLGSGALLLGRVRDAQADGSGGVPPGMPPVLGFAPWVVEAISEVPLVNGNGFVVYEVLEASAGALESAEWPAFLVLEQRVNGQAASWLTISLAPVSSEAGFAAAPVPRFADSDPPPDCWIRGDCQAGYQPLLAVSTTNLSFRLNEGANFQDLQFWVQNARGGNLGWSASVRYITGSGWLRLEPASGLNETNVVARASAAGLAPGTYAAVITVDGGPIAGSKEISVRLEVVALPPPDPSPVIRSVVNAASFSADGVVAGSLVTVFADKLEGGTVSLSFDGLPARILFAAQGQLNAVAPAGLAGKTQASAVLTVGGLSSAPFLVKLSPCAPAIFASGILNQDNTVNGSWNPAVSGSVVQVFMTGIPAQAAVTAKVHDWENQQPLYAGPAPANEGLQQVNLRIPPGLPAMQTEIVVCARPSGAPAAACSKPAKVYLKSEP